MPPGQVAGAKLLKAQPPGMNPMPTKAQNWDTHLAVVISPRRNFGG